MLNKGTISVLVVDDNADVAQMWKRTINAEADMSCAGTLDSADDLLSRVAELKPDIVLVDLNMPGKDPLDAVRELRTRSAATRVVVNTGYSDDTTVKAAIAAGAVSVICKSDSIADSLSVLRRTAMSTL